MGVENDLEVVADEKASQLKIENAGNRLAPAQSMSEEEFTAVEKKLKRKLDVRLMTMVWLIFVLNYLDRVSHSDHTCCLPNHICRTTLQLQKWPASQRACTLTRLNMLQLLLFCLLVMVSITFIDTLEMHTHL